MSRRHDIVLVSFIQKDSERQWVEELRPFCKRIELVHLPTWRSLLNCLGAVFSSVPFQVAYFRSRRMGELVRRVVSEERPDAVHIHLIRMAQHAEGLRGVPKVVDLTDATSLYLSRFRSASRNPLKKLLLGEELRRILAYESRLTAFELSLVCSPLDLSVMRRNVPQANVGISRNAVDMGRFPRLDGTVQAGPGRLIFTGNMTYFPNADAAQFLVRDILPLVRLEVPAVELFLVGQNPPPSVRALAGNGVVVTGFVEDIRSEYARSTVAVAPVRFGSGTLYKLLEPLALGVPVVTTSTGIGGLDLIAGEDVLVADDARGLADHIVRLLRDPGLRQSLTQRAAAKVRALHDLEIVAGDLEREYAGLVTERGHGGKGGAR
jgi:glycosyltransferase involved in cell wall biosynthesis